MNTPVSTLPASQVLPHLPPGFYWFKRPDDSIWGLIQRTNGKTLTIGSGRYVDGGDFSESILFYQAHPPEEPMNDEQLCAAFNVPPSTPLPNRFGGTVVAQSREAIHPLVEALVDRGYTVTVADPHTGKAGEIRTVIQGVRYDRSGPADMNIVPPPGSTATAIDDIGAV